VAAKPKYGKREVGTALISMGGAVAGVGIVGLNVVVALVGAALTGMGVIARRRALRDEDALRAALRAGVANDIAGIESEVRRLLRTILCEQGLPHTDKDVDDFAALLKRLPE
jgi:hypothetical protein